jgi:exopolysaccharide production protein ExoZ
MMTTAQMGDVETARPRSLVWVDPDHGRTSRTQFASLEYLRVVASFMIILFHAHSIALKHAEQRGEAFFAAPIFWYSCIELFFVMSGFLMIHMSRNLYGQPGGVWNFFVRRATRTPPLYWIYTIAIAALFLAKPSLSAQGPIDGKIILGSLLFYPMASPPVIAIGWTLDYEVFFYTIIGVSILLPYRWGWKFAIAALIGFVSLGAVLHVNTNPWGTWTDPLMLNFALGISVAVAYYSGVTLSRAGSWAAILLGLVLVCLLHRLVNRDLLRFVTMGFGIGLIVASATLNNVQWSLGRWHNITHELSNQTYTMYLCHILVLKFFEIFYFRLFNGFLADVGFVLLGFVLVVGVSRLLYVVGEKPITAYLRGFKARSPAPRMA